MSTEKISVEDGKYTVVFDGGKLSALRYGEPWRDLSGDKLVYALMCRIQSLEAAALSPATVAPSRGAVNFGALSLASELAEAVAKDDADEAGHDMASGMFGRSVTAWLRKVSSDFLGKSELPPKPADTTQVSLPATTTALQTKAGLDSRASGTPQPQAPNFDQVRDKRMSDLTPAQQADAMELWLREQIGWMPDYHRNHYQFLLGRIDEARGNPPRGEPAKVQQPTESPRGLARPRSSLPGPR